MKEFGLFRYLQPSLYSGLLDDPVLLINVRPTGRSILLDCGQLHHLAKRVLRSIDTVFVSHAHMDHFMGFDHLLRHVHVAPRTLTLFGPPGIADRVEHKLAGYDWNLVEDNWCTVAVCEIHPSELCWHRFPGSRGFARNRGPTKPRQGSIVYQTPYLNVSAELCDHKIPVLIFRVTERQSFLLDREKIEAAGLQPGPWVKELKRRFHTDQLAGSPIEVWVRNGDGHRTELRDNAGQLLQSIRRTIPPASIGYISDLGMTGENMAVITRLLSDVTLLVSECTFLAADRDKARISCHLCTDDLIRITREVKPNYLLPIHLSKSYINDTGALYRELALPPGTRLLQLPDYMTPRPLLPDELSVPVDQL